MKFISDVWEFATQHPAMMVCCSIGYLLIIIAVLRLFGFIGPLTQDYEPKPGSGVEL